MGPLVYIHLLKRQAALQLWVAERVPLALALGSTCRTPPFQPDTAPCRLLVPAAYVPLSPQPSLLPQPPCPLSLRLLYEQSPLWLLVQEYHENLVGRMNPVFSLPLSVALGDPPCHSYSPWRTRHSQQF